MSEIVTRIEDAQSLLKAKVIAIDCETDTHDYHWQKNWARGLSFNADITHLSIHAGPKHPTLVLKAERTEVPYAVDEVVYDEIEGFQWKAVDYDLVERRCLKDEWVLLGSPTERFENHNIIWRPSYLKGHYGYISEKKPRTKFLYRFSDAEIKFLHQLLNRPITVIGHNLIFDARQVWGRLKIPVHPQLKGWCTQAMNIFLLGYEQDPYSPRGGLNGLLDVYEREVRKLTREEKSFLKGMKDARGILHTQDEDDILRYVAWDAVAAYEIALVQSEKEYEVPPGYPFTFDQLLEYEKDYMRWCIEVCSRGIRLDVDYLKRMWLELEQIVHEETTYLNIDREVLGSVDKLRKVLFEDWKVPKPSEEDVLVHPELKTKTDGWAMSDDALKWYANNATDEDLKDSLHHLRNAKRAHERIRSLAETYRHAETDGRIHTLLSRHTVTGRNTSGSPNLQNLMFRGDSSIPSGKYTDRGLLIADPGHVMVEQDYSNAEVWMISANAGDDVLAKACCSTDFHSVAARGYFGAERWDNADRKERKYMRSLGKSVTFGVNYGMMAKSLATKLTQDSGTIVTYEEADQLIQGMRRTFRKTAHAMDETTKFAEKHEYVILWTGRLVKVPSFYKDGKKVKVKGYAGWNSRAQGGVGEAMTQALVQRSDWLKDNGFQTWDCLQVHDSIITQVKIDEYLDVIQPLIGIMQNVVPESWCNRTLPYRARFLVTVDHSENSGKWGWRDGMEYPFDTRSYVNYWGFHQLEEGQEEAPTWINEWGYGEEALAKELAYLESIGIQTQIEEIEEQFTRRNVSTLLSDIMDRMSYYAMGQNLDDYLERLAEIIQRMDENRYKVLVEHLQAAAASEPEQISDQDVRKYVHLLNRVYPYHNHFYDISELWPRAQRHEQNAVAFVGDWIDLQIQSAVQIFKRQIRNSPESAFSRLDALISH